MANEGDAPSDKNAMMAFMHSASISECCAKREGQEGLSDKNAMMAFMHRASGSECCPQGRGQDGRDEIPLSPPFKNSKIKIEKQNLAILQKQ